MKPTEEPRDARRAETDRALQEMARRLAVRLDRIVDEASTADEGPPR